MAFGQIRKGKGLGSFGQNQLPSIAGGIPTQYSLDFFSTDSYLGVPFYHFSSDWDRAGGTINFETSGDGGHQAQEARVGDLVSKWKNMYLAPDQGDAFVPSISVTTGGFSGPSSEIHYPTLVEKTYNGRPYRGLKFTGTEHLQIDGATVANIYNPPAPIFSTGGAPWAGNKGATFMFVIDQDVIDSQSVNLYANGVQSLLMSRQPLPTTMNPTPVPPAFTWPQTEDLGIQYFRNGSSYSETFLALNNQRWGPEGATTFSTNSGISITKPPLGAYGGAAYGEWERDPRWAGLPSVALDERANSGFQVILLEYNNEDSFKFTASSTPSTTDRDYNGPRVKIYALSPQGGAWSESPGHENFDIPRLISVTPALRNHTLFHDKNAFLGGTPGARATHVNNEFGNGFRGIIYEVMMLEGILSTADKSTLQRELLRKYRGAL